MLCESPLYDIDVKYCYSNDNVRTISHQYFVNDERIFKFYTYDLFSLPLNFIPVFVSGHKPKSAVRDDKSIAREKILRARKTLKYFYYNIYIYIYILAAYVTDDNFYLILHNI